jgi:hypothetical protein
MKTKKPDAKRAMQHFERLCRHVAQRKSPFEGMTEEEVIEKLRKTREELWEKKLATRS